MSATLRRALIAIDIQNDYFPSGRFPLWLAEATLDCIERAIAAARAAGVPVILVQHVAVGAGAPFFIPGTPGVELHPRVLAAAPDATVVVKAYADAFHHTALAATLAELAVDELLLCGMMTQNCVTHTALSRAAEPYAVNILTDGCTTVSDILHKIALNALSTRVALTTTEAALPGCAAPAA